MKETTLNAGLLIWRGIVFVITGVIDEFCLAIGRIVVFGMGFFRVEFIKVAFRAALSNVVLVQFEGLFDKVPIGVNVMRMIIDPLTVFAGIATVPDEMLDA